MAVAVDTAEVFSKPADWSDAQIHETIRDKIRHKTTSCHFGGQLSGRKIMTLSVWLEVAENKP